MSGSAAVSVLREVFTRCDSNILGASGCTGDSVFMGTVWLFGTVDSKSTFDACDVSWKRAKNLVCSSVILSWMQPLLSFICSIVI